MPTAKQKAQRLEAKSDMRTNHIVAVIKDKTGRITDVKIAGSGHLYPVEKIAQWILDCGLEFYTLSPSGSSSKIGVAHNSKKYLQSEGDKANDWKNDNLHSLPIAAL
jgi:uncharacterized protein DUF3892